MAKMTATLDDLLDAHLAGCLAATELRRKVVQVPPSAPIAVCESAVAAMLRWLRAGGSPCTVHVWASRFYGGTNSAYVLRQLSAAGLLTDAPDPHDRRRRQIRPTAEGRAYAARLTASWGEA
jgi:hypothetical protein